MYHLITYNLKKMEKTKKRIIETAIKAMAQNPKATMDEIAELAGVGRATVYRHYRTREVLIRELLLEAQSEFNNIVMPILNSSNPPMEKLSEAVKCLIPLGGTFRFLMDESVYAGISGVNDIYNEFKECWRTLIKELKSVGELSQQLSETWIAYCLDSLIYTAWEAIYYGDIARNDATDLVLNTFLNGVANQPSRQD